MAKACLIVIDGWGNSDEKKGNAILNANTPVMDNLTQTYPTVPLAAHGLAVGLPDGLMGNSEVGHLNIGAGRVVYQVLVFSLINLFLGYRSYRIGNQKRQSQKATSSCGSIRKSQERVW